MITAAADDRRQHPLLLGLEIAWFLAAAIALPLLELLRNGRHLFFSPAEPKVIRELLHDVLRQQKDRPALGQP